MHYCLLCEKIRPYEIGGRYLPGGQFVMTHQVIVALNKEIGGMARFRPAAIVVDLRNGMKLASFYRPQSDEKSYGIVTEQGVIDAGKKLSDRYLTLQSLLHDNALDLLQELTACAVDYPTEDIVFLPVIETPGKIFCVGMNYADKRKEFEENNNAPTLFIRFADSLCAHKDNLIKPISSDEFDYEGELAVVIGRYASEISKEDALDYVAGYSCFMDATVRDMQYTWFTSGKNWLKTGGFGPWLVTRDEIGDPQALPIETFLNGMRVQHDTTGNMIHSVADIIQYISRFSPLSPGDVIITGSPGGVGKKRTPPLFMKNGDVIEVTIGGIGTLVNQIASQTI